MENFDSSNFQYLIGKTIKKVKDYPDADRGLIITFTDDTKFEFYFSGHEGEAS